MNDNACPIYRRWNKHRCTIRCTIQNNFTVDHKIHRITTHDSPLMVRSSNLAITTHSATFGQNKHHLSHPWRRSTIHGGPVGRNNYQYLARQNKRRPQPYNCTYVVVNVMGTSVIFSSLNTHVSCFAYSRLFTLPSDSFIKIIPRRVALDVFSP